MMNIYSLQNPARLCLFNKSGADIFNGPSRRIL